VENSLLLPRKVLHTNGFRLSVHFYIILPATLMSLHQSWSADITAIIGTGNIIGITTAGTAGNGPELGGCPSLPS
jgi:hypothetical protein